jgi:phage gp36-like protein
MYGTSALFIEAFGQPEAVMLTNLDDPTITVVNPVPLNRALTDAAALIDSYLARRYQLPLSQVPQVLIPYALDIARYRLDRIRDRDDVRKRYEDAIKWLEGVRDGKNFLGTDVAANLPVDVTVSIGSVEFGSAQSINLVGF